MKQFILLLHLIFLPYLCYAQITIEERVDIEPLKNIYIPNDPASSHTVTAVVEWDTTGGTHNFLRARMNMINECTAETLLSNYSYNGYIELNMSSSDAVRYEINTFTETRNYPTYFTWYPFLFGHSLKIYADGLLVYENGNFSTTGSTSVLYWRSNLNLHISSYSWNNYEYALCPDESALIRVSDDEECQPALWNAGQDIQVSIVEGAEHTSFYYGGNILIGDNVTFSTDVHGNYFTAYGNVELNYDFEYTDTTADKLVVLEAVVNGITARDTILIPKSTGYVFNGEIEDGKERIVKWERLRINSWLETGGMCVGVTAPPEGTTFNAEVTQGAEFGGLVDTTTGETTTLLSGLMTDGNQLSIEYFADGDSVQSDEEIIVKISSSIPEVEPLYISFFTGRSEIFVTIDPEELLAGEMSDVAVYSYDEMDSLLLLPGDLPFQAEIIEGAEFGDIYDPVSNQYSDYFDEIYQGFKFKAAEEIDTSSARVLIRVSTLFGGGITSPIGQGGNNETENSISITNEAEDKDTKGENTDIGFFFEAYGIGAVEVSGGDCSNAPQCTDIAEAPVVELKNVDDSLNCIKPRQRGKFKSKLLNPFDTVNVSVCYNGNDDKWQFNIEPENKIFVRYSLEICKENMRNRYKLIEDLEQLATIPSDSVTVCSTYSDILWHQEYGAVGAGQYFIYEVTVEHENWHLNDFAGIVYEIYFNKYYDKFLEYAPSCSEIKNVAVAKQKGSKKYYGYLDNFRKDVILALQKKTGKKGSPEREKYEQDTQDKVKYLIFEYYAEMKRLHPDKEPCEYCNIGCESN